MPPVLTPANPAEHPFARYVRILGKGKTGSRSLSFDEAQAAMAMILDGRAEALQVGAFLMLLRVKEESAEEIAGFVSAARVHIRAPAALSADLDWSSYAGKRRQLPWFLFAVALLTEHGYSVFMHGSSGHTAGRIYTSQVLEALGIAPARNWNEVGQQLQDQHFSYLGLESFCPALQALMDYRNLLGLRSPVHTLARLLNPLRCRHSLQSVFHPAYAKTHQQASLLLEQPVMAVFKGESGEIERKPEADCLLSLVQDGACLEERWHRLLEGRQPVEAEPDINTMVSCWRGEIRHQYAELAITGTLAIALRVLGVSTTQEQALKIAQQWWLNRNKAKF